MDQEIVKELIQNELNENNLKAELDKLLNSSSRKAMLDNYALLKEKLGGSGASAKAAELMIGYLK
jgi:lipid-A-disaccharide synthase